MKILGISKTLVIVVLFLMFASGYVTYAATGTKQSIKTDTKYITGPQGPIGPAGPQGLQGASGTSGLQGVAGVAGATGAQGIQGPAGQNAANAITSSTTLTLGDISGSFASGLTVNRIGGTSITLNGGSTGDVLTQQSDGSFAPSALSKTGNGRGVDIDGYTSYSSGQYSLEDRSSLYFDITNFKYGYYDRILTAPVLQYGASSTVATFGYLNVNHMDLSHDGYDLRVDIKVLSQDQSHGIDVSGFCFISGGSTDTSGSCLPSNLNSVSDIGSGGLTYNSTTGVITTNASNTYTVIVHYHGEWD